MEYPPDTLPQVPPGGVTCGIDWANDDHAVCVVDAAGKIVQRFTAEHTGEGLAGLVRRLRRAGFGEVAIERPDGKVVDTLLEAGLTIVVISPSQLKNLRGRYGSAGNKDDRFDAFVLADTLRTDRARLRPLLPDSPATVTLPLVHLLALLHSGAGEGPHGAGLGLDAVVGHQAGDHGLGRAYLHPAKPLIGIQQCAEHQAPVEIDALGRYRFERNDVLSRQPPSNLHVTFRTVHGSKGSRPTTS